MYLVMLVDDEAPIINNLMAFHWQDYDCRVIATAGNGEEALKKCEALLPDIVISDIAMPLMNGIDFMHRIHQIHPGIQFILLTVHKSFDYAHQAIRYDAADYIIKDLNIHQVLGPALEKAQARINAAGPALERGAVMRLDASASALINRARIGPFVKNGPGTLAGVRITPGFEGMNALFDAIKPALADIGNAKYLLRDGNAFEALLPLRMLPRLNAVPECFRDARAVMAYASGVYESILTRRRGAI